MKSRERVLAALEHRETDRVPIDFSGHRSSGIAAIAYPKLRKFLGLPPENIVAMFDTVNAGKLEFAERAVADRRIRRNG